MNVLGSREVSGGDIRRPARDEPRSGHADPVATSNDMDASTDRYELPMFPLGSVLFPGMILPLHVFEDRYRRLMADVIDGAQEDIDRKAEFGVVLIERGAEVGGGDIRAMTACVAEVVQHQEEDDGRRLVIGVGRRRVRVDQWLPDDRYPRALVSDWDDEPGADAAMLEEVRAATMTRYERVVELAAELGADMPPQEFVDEPIFCSYQTSILAPFGDFDRQRLLAAPTVLARYEILMDELEGVAATLEYRLADEG